ncbi:MAG: outer membrane beta-barrel protein [Burkholderiales bacterium]
MWTKSLCALGVLTLSASALAQVPTAPRRTGVYVYGSIGASQGNDRSASLDRATANLGVGPIATIDGKRMVGGATIGYRMNSYFGLEAGYMDLGRMELRATDSTGAGNFTSQTKIRGAHAAIVGYLPTTEDSAVYAKFGSVWSRTRYEASDGFKDSSSTVRTYWGLGLQVFFDRQIFGRAEYLRFPSLGSTYSGNAAFNHYNLALGYLF